ALIPASVATATATATASASEKAPQAKPTTTTKQPIPSVLQHADDGVRDITLSLYYYSFVSLSLPTQRRYYKRHSAKYLFVPDIVSSALLVTPMLNSQSNRSRSSRKNETNSLYVSIRQPPPHTQ